MQKSGGHVAILQTQRGRGQTAGGTTSDLTINPPLKTGILSRQAPQVWSISGVRFYISHLGCQMQMSPGRFLRHGHISYVIKLLCVIERLEMSDKCKQTQRRRHIISFGRHQLHCGALMHVCPALLGIHQHQPLLINPFCSSYCLSMESSLRPPTPAAAPPAAIMVFSHFEHLIGCKSEQTDGYVEGTGALECPLLPSISVSPGDCVLLGCVWRYEICSPAVQQIQSLKASFSIGCLLVFICFFLVICVSPGRVYSSI